MSVSTELLVDIIDEKNEQVIDFKFASGAAELHSLFQRHILISNGPIRLDLGLKTEEIEIISFDYRQSRLDSKDIEKREDKILPIDLIEVLNKIINGLGRPVLNIHKHLSNQNRYSNDRRRNSITQIFTSKEVQSLDEIGIDRYEKIMESEIRVFGESLKIMNELKNISRYSEKMNHELVIQWIQIS